MTMAEIHRQETEHYQQQLELQEQAFQTIKNEIRAAVISAPHDATIGMVWKLKGNKFIVTSLGGYHYTVTIEELQ
jgi:hypothetical protein